MKFGLRNDIIKQVNYIFARYPQIEKAIIYGSRAKGNYKTGSDIDLSLTGEDLSLSLIHAIELEIDDLLLPYTFDISIFNQISNPDLIEHINRAGLDFYQKFTNSYQWYFNVFLNNIGILKYLMYKLYIKYKVKEKIHGHKNIYSRRQKKFRRYS